MTSLIDLEKKKKPESLYCLFFLKNSSFIQKSLQKKNTCENQTTKTGIVNKKSSRTK